MKRILFGLLLVPAAAASAADLRLFFSVDDPVGPGHAPLPAPASGGVMSAAASPGMPLLSPSELSTQAIPQLPATGGRLHLWGTGSLGDPDPYVWNGIGIQVTFSGAAQVSAGGGLNVTSPTSFQRWETGSDFNPVGTPSRWNFIAVTRSGLQLPAMNDGWDNGSDAVYLGYIDLVGDGQRNEVYLSADSAGISRQGGNSHDDHVYFGWLPDNDFPPYQSPEAIIVPEPASLFALFAGGLFIKRRR